MVQPAQVLAVQVQHVEVGKNSREDAVDLVLQVQRVSEDAERIRTISLARQQNL